MTRRRRFVTITGTLLAALLATALTWWLLTPASRITRENHDKLRPGMTRAEVEEILGGPPRYEPHGPVTAWAPWGGERPVAVPVSSEQEPRQLMGIPEGGRQLAWVSEYGLIAVSFEPDGTVFRTYFSPVTNEQWSILSALRRFLPR